MCFLACRFCVFTRVENVSKESWSQEWRCSPSVDESQTLGVWAVFAIKQLENTSFRQRWHRLCEHNSFQALTLTRSDSTKEEGNGIKAMEHVAREIEREQNTKRHHKAVRKGEKCVYKREERPSCTPQSLFSIYSPGAEMPLIQVSAVWVEKGHSDAFDWKKKKKNRFLQGRTCPRCRRPSLLERPPPPPVYLCKD